VDFEKAVARLDEALALPKASELKLARASAMRYRHPPNAGVQSLPLA
jgi:hypothetical protein